MNKIILAVLLLSGALNAQLTQVWATPDFADRGIKIIDIRTPAEWKETGIVKGSYTIMFFNEKGDFNLEGFLRQLSMAVKKDEQFALICRVGSRTGMVAEFLSEKLGYDVINLQGGIMKMIHEGYKTVPYTY